MELVINILLILVLVFALIGIAFCYWLLYQADKIRKELKKEEVKDCNYDRHNYCIIKWSRCPECNQTEL